MICHALVKMALHWQRLIDKLLVVLFLRVLGEQHAHTRSVNTRPGSTTHHLEDV